MTKGEQAEKLFFSGRNCSQSVALCFCEEMGLSEELVARQTLGFGGGMGRMREVCGTLAGATYVLSNLYAEKGKAELYGMIQTVAKEFGQKTGSVVCRNLLGIKENGMSDPRPALRTPEYYQKRPCPSLCRLTAEILDGFICEYNKSTEINE